jgi:hypothetical protein
VHRGVVHAQPHDGGKLVRHLVGTTADGQPARLPPAHPEQRVLRSVRQVHGGGQLPGAVALRASRRHRLYPGGSQALDQRPGRRNAAHRPSDVRRSSCGTAPRCGMTAATRTGAQASRQATRPPPLAGLPQPHHPPAQITRICDGHLLSDGACLSDHGRILHLNRCAALTTARD